MYTSITLPNTYAKPMSTNNQKTKKDKNKDVRIRVPQSTVEKLDAKAKTCGLSRNALAQLLINQYINGQIELKL